MTISLTDAQQQLAPDVQKNIDWFIEGDELYFIDPATVTVAAGIALTWFFWKVVEGLKEPVGEAGKELGKEIGTRAIAAIKQLVNKNSAQEQFTSEHLASEAKRSLESVSDVQATVIFEQIEIDIRDRLIELMPESQASEFSARIRQSAVQVVYTQID